MYWNNNWNTTLTHVVVGRLLKQVFLRYGTVRKPGLNSLRINQPMDHDFKGWDTRRKKPDFLSLHKHPCSFTCEDKLQKCSSSACGVLERNVKFPQTNLVSYHRSALCLCWEQVPTRPRPCTSHWPCGKELLVQTNQVERGGRKQVHLLVLHVKRASWKSLLSPSLRSLPWIPVWAESSLFQFYLGSIWITLILCTSGSFFSISD